MSHTTISSDLTEQVFSFEERLTSIDIQMVSGKEYCRRYLQHLLDHKRYYLEIYADVLRKLQLHALLPKSEINLVDYGAGNGLLGIFAKFCGFGKVYINDLDADFVAAARQLSSQLKIDIDGFIVGDIHQLKPHVHEKFNAIAGTDVIEHIYDLHGFIQVLREINPEVVSVFTTGSNPENYFKVRELKKIQKKDELIGGEPNEHLLFGAESLQPYLHIRKQIIRDHFPGLNNDLYEELAIATRGMIERDIVAAVKTYQQDRILPLPAAGDNTCNPLSGSWTERLLSLEEYRDLFGRAGFTTEIYPGFYNQFEKTRGNFVKKMLNKVITISGCKISPYIVIVGFKK